MSFFMVRNGQFLRDWKTSHSHCIWMSARPIHGVAFLSCWFTLKGVCCCCEEISEKRTRVFEDDVFIENTRLVGGSKTQGLNLRADVVLNMSHGPPGQWFPETEYWASAIFVETSGIPPKIIYRSVKSYMLEKGKKLWNVKLTVILIESGVLDTVTIGLIKGLEDSEIRGWVETIQTTAIMWSIRILSRVLKTWKD